MEKIKEDVNILEHDLEDIRCNPIIKFLQDFFKCIEDSIAYIFKEKE